MINMTFSNVFIRVETSCFLAMLNLQSSGFAIILFLVKYRQYEKRHSFLLYFQQVLRVDKSELTQKSGLSKWSGN